MDFYHGRLLLEEVMPLKSRRNLPLGRSWRSSTEWGLTPTWNVGIVSYAGGGTYLSRWHFLSSCLVVFCFFLAWVIVSAHTLHARTHRQAVSRRALALTLGLSGVPEESLWMGHHHHTAKVLLPQAAADKSRRVLRFHRRHLPSVDLIPLPKDSY